MAERSKRRGQLARDFRRCLRMVPAAPQRRVFRAIARCAWLGFLLSSGCVVPSDSVDVLPQPVRALVDSLIVDEYRGVARYRVLESRFGGEPFRALVSASERRVEALATVYRHHFALPPDNPYRKIGLLERYESLGSACGIALVDEEETVARYQRLLNTPTAAADVRSVARTNLANTKHLEVPAVRRCATR